MAPVLLDSLLKMLAIDGQRHLDWHRFTSKTAGKPKPSLCQAPGCGNHIDQNAYGRTRLYCSDVCSWRAAAHRARERAAIVAGTQPRPEPEKEQDRPEPENCWSPWDYGWTKGNGWPSREVFDRYMKGLPPAAA